MIDKKKIQKKQEKAKRIEKLENRIIINYGVAAAAYMILNTLYRNPFYMNFKYVLPIAAVMLVAAIVCYVCNIKFKKTKNYGHMFLAFAIALAITNASTIIYKLFGENVFNSLQNMAVIGKAMNSKNATIGVSILGVIYLVGMTIYNGVLIYRVNHNKANKKTEKK